MKCIRLNYFKTVVLIIISTTVFFSCTYEKAELKQDCTLPVTVSFNQNVLPIFNTQCSVPGCHTGAAHAGNLNLDASVAYNQLSNYSTGYIDTLNPEYSVLYSKLISSSDVMPPSGKLDNCKIQLILKWIQQKAKNN
jgi:hypothetical protein